MSDYGHDESDVARGRARVPGNGSGPVGPPPPDDVYQRPAYDDAWGPADYAQDGPVSPAAGRASTGRAAVRPAGGYDAPRPPADSDAFDPFAAVPPATAPGRAQVPGAAGRAPVGRASVGAPERPGNFDPGVPGRPGNFGPGGPVGPAGPGSGGPGHRGPGGSGAAVPRKSKPATRKTRRRILIGLASLIVLTGFAIVGIAYYSSTIVPPDQIKTPQATTIYYSDGKTVLAQIGSENRTIIPAGEITPVVRQAVIATEDSTFYSNVGVDFKGIARAFVNNITGGQTQGASTITQQYARAIDGLDTAPSYSRKAKEIVLAIKLNRSMSKDDILTNYLNTVNFGRGSYGIQAAARAYFGKDAKDLTANQAMVLAGLIKDPNGGIYDPACGTPSAKGAKKPPCQTALDRFAYTRSQMAVVPTRTGFIPHDQVAALAYPTDWVREDTSTLDQAMAMPEGFIVHHVMSELTQPVDGHAILTESALKDGGYQIVTTIDKVAQAAADRIAGGTDPNSPVRALKKGIGAALVAVQPGTGNVVAYYGGSNGGNIDFGGIYDDPVTTNGGWSGHNAVPGSSFKTITMAAALQAGLSIDSYWYGPLQRTFDDRPGNPVHNAGTEACPGAEHVCSMWMGLKESLNTMYYAIGEYQNKEAGISMSPAKVIDMAGALGIKNLWPPSDRCGGVRQPVTGTNGGTLYPKCFSAEVSFGQFGVALQDMAAAMGTMANHGTRVDEHFVDHVTQGQGSDRHTVYKSSTLVKSTPVPNMTPEQFDDETWAMQQVFKNHDELDNQLAGGRPAAVKTGTYQLGDTAELAKVNGSAYFNGFTAGDVKNGQIAASVWVGYTGKPQPLETTAGKAVGGAATPASVWQQFIDAYEANGPDGKPWPIQQFSPPHGTGNEALGERPSPSPPAPTGSGAPSSPPPTGGSPAGTPPTAPTGLTVTGTTNTSVSLSWTASTDDVGVTGYDIYRGPTKVGSVPGTAYTENGLSPGTGYTYRVVALDGGGEMSPPSTPVTATTTGGGGGGGGDKTPPSAPTGVTVTAASPTSVLLSWTASTDNVGVTGYVVFRGIKQVGSVTGTTFTDTSVKAGKTYIYTVRAKDAAGNQSTPSTPVKILT